MKTLILTLIILTGCISTNSKGYIKTKDNEVTKFHNADLVFWPKETWVIRKNSEVSFENKYIKEISIEKE